jgi:signal transduction histidine kinase
MLGQIQQRDVALVEANEQSEARVSERTAELQRANERLTQEITARRRTDSALAAANERLADTVVDLRRSNKELQDFAYVAAHDLKAPLRGIGTLADWIATDYADKLDEAGRQQLGLLKRRVTRLTALINGILHYSEICRLTDRWEAVDLGKLVPETIALLDPPAHIQVVVRGELPAVVSEKVRLGQVFHNLIDNAIKYMDKPQGRVEIGCTDQGRTWRFEVADNGPGIEERHFEKIFQMFQTLAPRDQRESTGIGLPIVKKIVELFGGRVWVESKPGIGSTFFFTLPKQAAGAEREALVMEQASLN